MKLQRVEFIPFPTKKNYLTDFNFEQKNSFNKNYPNHSQTGGGCVFYIDILHKVCCEIFAKVWNMLKLEKNKKENFSYGSCGKGPLNWRIEAAIRDYFGNSFREFYKFLTILEVLGVFKNKFLNFLNIRFFKSFRYC